MHPVPTRQARFQFSLAWLLIAFTCIAIALGLSAVFGPVFRYFGFWLYLLVRCVIPTPLVISAIYGRGKARVFSIGALAPWVLVVPWDRSADSFQALPFLLVISGVCGFVAFATWRWICDVE